MKTPVFREPGLTDYLTRAFEEQDRNRSETLSKVTANHSLLLQSPSNKIYEVTVSDAGALVITLVADQP